MRNLHLLLVFGALAAYAVTSFLNSSDIGIKDADRSGVYPILALLIILVSVCNVFESPLPASSPVNRTLFVFAGLVLAINMLRAFDPWTALVHVGLTMWWAMTFTYFARQSYWNQASTPVVIKTMSAIFVAYVAATLYAHVSISRLYDTQLAVVNTVYFVLALAPFTLLLASPRARAACLVLWIAAASISFKRGALIATLGMLLTYFLVRARVQGRDAKLVKPTLLAFGTLAAVLIGADKLSGGLLRYRFSSEQLVYGSGRVEIYGSLVDSLKVAPLNRLLFGQGSGWTESMVGTGAHNDWLESFASFGLIGAVAYSVLLVAIFALVFGLVRHRASTAPAAAAALVYVVVVGALGGVILTHSTFYVMALLGHLYGRALAESEQEGIVQ